MWSISGLVISLVIGLVIGALAKFVMPGRDPGGLLVTMLLGIAGAFVADLVGRTFGWYRHPYAGPGIIASVLGAVLLLVTYRAVAGRKSTT